MDSFKLYVVILMLGLGCAQIESQIRFDIPGKYSWELLFDIDNTENAGSITTTQTVKCSISTSYSKLVKSVKDWAIKTNVEATTSGILKIVNVGFKTNIDSSVSSLVESTVQEQKENRIETVKTEEFVVGPKSRLKLYRLVFNGPGISYATSTISSSPNPVPDVMISVTASPETFLQNIDVIYTDDAVSMPENCIQEIDNKNNDINAGFGGKYVCLIPIWTTNPKLAANGIQVFVQGSENKNFKDLAKGAGGKYRYIKMIRNNRSPKIINEVGLLRSEMPTGPKSHGYEYSTIDINKGRKKDYLYLVYNTFKVHSW